MRHIFGVAFSGVEMDDAAFRELELLFLRVVLAVVKAREGGDEAQGYLSVVRQEARDVVRRMKASYGVGDEVRVVFANVLVSDLARLADAAERARSGDDASAEREVAGRISAGALVREIEALEHGVVRVEHTHSGPFGVEWDFYGTARSRYPGAQSEEPMCPRLL